MFFRIAKIDGTEIGAVIVHELDEAIDKVIDISKGTCLRSLPMNDDFFSL